MQPFGKYVSCYWWTIIVSFTCKRMLQSNTHRHRHTHIHTDTCRHTHTTQTHTTYTHTEAQTHTLHYSHVCTCSLTISGGSWGDGLLERTVLLGGEEAPWENLWICSATLPWECLTIKENWVKWQGLISMHAKKCLFMFWEYKEKKGMKCSY